MKRFMVFCILTAVGCSVGMVQAQTIYDNVDFSEGVVITFKGKKPTIVDFVTAEENMFEEHPEFLGDVFDAWKKYLRGRKCKKNETLTVDIAYGYVRYEQRNVYDGEVSCNVKEFCYWNCEDSRYKLFASNVYCYYDGVYFDGQYNGICFYLYDSETHMLGWKGNGLDENDVWGLDSAIGYVPTEYNLPRQGKDITVKLHTPDGMVIKKVVWNGNGFTFQ